MGSKTVRVRGHKRSTPKSPPSKHYPKPGQKTVKVKPHKRTPPSD